MIIVESGGTKSSWTFRDPVTRKLITRETVGLHPNEISEEKKGILNEFIAELPDGEIRNEIHFYGAGCEGNDGKTTILNELETYGFRKIHVETDLKAACLAVLGNNPGYAAILGTGAIAAAFDGNDVTKRTSGLGYILGDEGSGFDIGRRLLRSYFYKDLPEEIETEIKNYFHPHEDILHRIYRPDGRKIVAGLSLVAHSFKSEKTVCSLINQAFEDFYIMAILPLGKVRTIGFVGSIAFYFEKELREVLDKHNIEVLKIHQSAIQGLIDLHERG
ncbi:MAG: hypothetical protein R3277_04295 [Brumimicrobium sp.]|nr:hypothetical protein [Brumimicrobium sp.]